MAEGAVPLDRRLERLVAITQVDASLLAAMHLTVAISNAALERMCRAVGSEGKAQQGLCTERHPGDEAAGSDVRPLEIVPVNGGGKPIPRRSRYVPARVGDGAPVLLPVPTSVEAADGADAFAVGKLSTDHEVPAIASEARPGGDTDFIVLIVTALGHSILGGRLEALQPVLEDQVDHAGDRIGSPSGGRATRDHFGTLDQDGGNQSEVDLAIDRSRHMSTAVHQGQRAHAPETSQVRWCLPDTVERLIAVVGGA